MALDFKDNKQERAYDYFKNECMSIEVIKDDYLQKLHFRVLDKTLIREDVKELVKWNIDRTSPSAKLRDLVFWSRDILREVDYQKKMLKNPVLKWLAMRWTIWNLLSIFMSVCINIVMLVTWEAPYTLKDVPANATALSHEIYSFKPKVNLKDWDLVLLVMGCTHNFFSQMLFLCYILLKHPTLPDVWGTVKSIFAICKKKKKGEEEMKKDLKPEHKSKLEVKFISGSTLYYLMLVGLSVAGSFFYGYFFAFHMVNIMVNNELLKGVVKAVTQNGQSLMWVAIVGVIIIYIYALIAFAFMRPSFDTGDVRYCGSLAECFVTLIRYGGVGELTENLAIHPLQNNFQTFSYMVIFQVTFFILFTTIALNVIFGIIVDTFSELRNLKWTAEKDMRDTCFICSRDSYDFEQTGQGMLNHVKNDHNMWAYVYYFMHLKDVQQSDYTALDLYVSKLLAADKLDFFPLDRAMSLVGTDDDEKDTRLEDLMTTLKIIKESQDKEWLQMKREKEREKIAEIREEYKQWKFSQSEDLEIYEGMSERTTPSPSEIDITDIFLDGNNESVA